MLCITVLCEVAQTFESGGPIPLVLREPRRQFREHRLRFKSIDLISPLTRCGHQTRRSETHQMLRDARLHQVGELGGEFADGERTALGE